ncbi:MAG: TetR/AcrR family transcriptional regulator [Mesorhizobium sp.]
MTIKSRRRGPLLENAILDAAWAELAVTGYEGLRMDAVAARAGTSKTVLYRRWPSRVELVLASLRKNSAAPAVAPDEGNLRDDVVAILTWLSDRYQSFPEIMRGIMVELPDVEGNITQSSVHFMTIAMDRAIVRGEIGPAMPSPRVWRVAMDLARYEMFVTRKPLQAEAIAELVDLIFMPLVSS